MARKTTTTVELIDDLDGSKADRPVTFAYNGTTYEIDLSKRNATAFDKAMKPRLKAARKAKQPRRRAGTTPRPRSRRTNLQDVRAWANANGHQVADRGRIPTTAMDAYTAVH
jgi:hypothetical protein